MTKEERIQQRIEASRSLLDFDKRLFDAKFGVEAVDFVRDTAEYMPDLNAPDHLIKSMLCIAYDKGFEDALNMIERVLAGGGSV